MTADKSTELGTDSNPADVIIVGGGSAGCVLAARLSEDPRLRVLLVEAGRDTPPRAEPADVLDPFYVAAYNPANMWPQLRVTWSRDAAGKPRTMWYEQARIMGGGSSVNSMIGLRGHSGDFDDWKTAAGPQWAWDKVAPYYRKLETDLDFAGPDHGSDGPIPIRRHARADWPPFCRAVETVLMKRGMPFIADANASPARDGFCAVPMTNLPHQRVSAAIGYLTAAVRTRPNLRLLANSHATEILFDCAQAIGVRVFRDGRSIDLKGREIVISSGSIHSPALLMRSGIGKASDLQRQGLQVRADRPGVGANLQEHPVAALAMLLKPGARQPDSMRAHGNLSIRYSSDTAGAAPQDMYMAISNKTSWHALGRRLSYMAVLLQQPFSRGYVRLASAEWRDEPEVHMNILSDFRDMERMANGLRYALDIAAEPDVARTYQQVFLASFSERVQGYNRMTALNAIRSRLALTSLDLAGPLRGFLVRNVIAPGSDAREIVTSPDALREWLTNNVAGYYHVAGTCRLGHGYDPMAVADPDAAVIGVRNLRVADNSLMPTIVRSQTNLTAMMIGEKVADIMKGTLRH